MSYEQRAQGIMREATELRESHPWSLIVLLTTAVCYALLAIAAAIDRASEE